MTNDISLHEELHLQAACWVRQLFTLEPHHRQELLNNLQNMINNRGGLEGVPYLDRFGEQAR